MGREFCANPMVLESSGIDIILGMGCLTKYDAIIQCAKRSVLLASLAGERFKFIAKLLSAVDCAVNQMRANLINDIRVVCEYSYAFPDDLPGMTHECVTKFIIDLLPGTAPIAKRPYRMSVGELEELMKQLKELLDKQFIRPSSSPRGALVILLRRNMVHRGCV